MGNVKINKKIGNEKMAIPTMKGWKRMISTPRKILKIMWNLLLQGRKIRIRMGRIRMGRIRIRIRMKRIRMGRIRMKRIRMGKKRRKRRRRLEEDDFYAEEDPEDNVESAPPGEEDKDKDGKDK